MNNYRIGSIDLLRGIAVILMINQHLGAWTVRHGFRDGALAGDLFYFINTTGMMAAPLFIFLTGVGSHLALQNRDYRPSTLIKRGLFIILCGYIVNLLTPSWLSPGSWYVLHLIGSVLILSPLLNRMSNLVLSFLWCAGFIIAVIGQTILATPVNIRWEALSSITSVGSFFTMVFFQGHFPVFPWISIAIAGIIVIRLLEKGKWKETLALGGVVGAAGLILAIIYSHGYGFAVYGKLFRIFVFKPTTHYPPFVSQILIENGLAIITCTLLYRLVKISPSRLITAIGRLALSLFIIHPVIFSNFFAFCGLTATLDPGRSLIIGLSLTAIICILVLPWSRLRFTGSAESIMRKICG